MVKYNNNNNHKSLKKGNKLVNQSIIQKITTYKNDHSYSFIENRNDRTHLHKYTQYKKDIKTVKTADQWCTVGLYDQKLA